MHSAPSVSYPVGRSLFAGFLASVLWLLAVGLLVLWLIQSPVWGLRHGAAVLALIASGLCSVQAWRAAAAGELRWDGRVWRLSVAPLEGAPAIVLDFQHVMLVQWRRPGGARSLWLWLARSGRPRRWDDLRRAVYSRASTADTPSHDSRAANP